jgi:hypothetical protein
VQTDFGQVQLSDEATDTASLLELATVRTNAGPFGPLTIIWFGMAVEFIESRSGTRS